MLKNCRISGFADEIDPNFDRQLEVVSRLKVPAIELRNADAINVSDLTAEKAAEVRKKLDDAGIVVSSIGSPIGKIEITDDFAPHFEKFRHTVEVAKMMDCPNIRMFSFFIPEGTDPASCRDEVLRRMERMVEYAAAHDVVLLHENEKEIYGDIASRCLDLMEQFAGDHFKAVFDFANFVQCHQDTLEAYEMLRPYIAYIHVKDARWADGSVVPSGQGDGHVEEILRRLDADGYQGWLSLEPHLSNFAALCQLEKHPMVRPEEWTGEMAFTTAHDALIGLLQKD